MDGREGVLPTGRGHAETGAGESETHLQGGLPEPGERLRALRPERRPGVAVRLRRGGGHPLRQPRRCSRGPLRGEAQVGIRRREADVHPPSRGGAHRRGGEGGGEQDRRGGVPPGERDAIPAAARPRRGRQVWPKLINRSGKYPSKRKREEKMGRRAALAMALLAWMWGTSYAGWFEDAVKGALEGAGKRAVDETTDSTYQGAKGKAKESVQKEGTPGQNADAPARQQPGQKPATGTAAAPAGEAAGGKDISASEQIYSKYDFVPGDKVIFYDDFSDTDV